MTSFKLSQYVCSNYDPGACELSSSKVERDEHEEVFFALAGALQGSTPPVYPASCPLSRPRELFPPG